MLKVSDRRRRTALERIYRLRLENMRTLVREFGSAVRLARALEINPSFVTHVAGENPIRTIGERMARGIESKLGLYSGWLDQIH